MKKIDLSKYLWFTRWITFLSFVLVVFIKMIETTSNTIYSMILTTPELVDYTSLADSAFFFFV